LLLAAVAAAGPFLYPATPAAADVAFVAKTVSVGSYRMRLVADRSFGTDITITLAQRRGRSLQSHSWTASRDRLSASGDLRSGRLRGRFAGGGFINMRFRARGAASRGPVQLCGRRLRSVGSLTGTLRVPTGAGRFGTVVRHRFGAWLARDRFLFCSSPWDPGLEDLPVFSVVKLNTFAGPGTLSVLNDRGTTVEWYEIFGTRSYHMAIARSRRRHFSFSSDHRRARATGFGPYFRGSLSFSATSKEYPGAFDGRVRGDLQVRLAAPRSVAAAPARAWIGIESP
jgi:hypothetical protein